MAGTRTGDNKSPGVNLVFNSTPQNNSFGGVADDWNATLSANHVNNSDFGVSFRFEVTGGGAAWTYYLNCSNFGFSIPSENTIDGITVNINVSSFISDVRANFVTIVIDHSGGTTSAIFPGTVTTEDGGSSTDWANPDNVKIDDTNYATNTATLRLWETVQLLKGSVAASTIQGISQIAGVQSITI